MKILFITFLLILNANLALANSINSFAPIVTEDDKAAILKIIDRDCADTWCSGDYEYQFLAFNCSDPTATCVLSFRIIDRDRKNGSTNFRNKRCTFRNITSKISSKSKS